MDRYFTDLASAFVRGRLQNPSASIADGHNAGLRLHKFKSDTHLPRVQRVLGILRGLAPTNLLDIGSGRGTLLWPLLTAFPHMPVTAIDLNEQRTKDLAAVHAGGVSRLTVVRMNAEQLAFAPKSFDVVTLLEVLEHMPNPPSRTQMCAQGRSTFHRPQRAIRTRRQPGTYPLVHSWPATTNGHRSRRHPHYH